MMTNRLMAVLIFCLFGIGCLAAADVTVSAEPYPVGNLQIQREQVTSSSFRLKLKNLDLQAEPSGRSRTQTWQIAGARGRQPQITVESANYIRVMDERKVDASNPPASLKDNLVRVTELGLFRNWWVYGATFTLTTADGADAQWVLTDASVIVDLGPPPPPSEGKLKKGRTFSLGEGQLLSSLLINPDVNGAYLTSEYSDPVAAWEAWTELAGRAAKKGSLFQFKVHGGGIYRLDKKLLAGSTSATITTPASQWRVYKGGQEVAAAALPNVKDALFLPVESGPGDSLYTDVYWIDTTGNGKGAPKRLEVAREKAGTTANHSTTASYSIVHRELADYNPRLKGGRPGDRWTWADIDPKMPAEVTLEMPDWYAPDAPVEVSVQYGFSNFPSLPPELQFYVNGRQAGETTLTQQQGLATFQVAGDALRPGENTVALALNYPLESEDWRPVSVQSIQTTWSGGLPQITSQTLELSVADAISTRVAGVRFPEPLMATDLLIGLNAGKAVQLQPAAGAMELAYRNQGKLMAVDATSGGILPAVQCVKKVMALKDIKAADSILIADPALASAAEELRKHHEERGLQAHLYFTDEIYNSFSYGQGDSSAVRNFLRYLFYRADGVQPSYVTLLGEASDFHGDLAAVPKSIQRDMVPASTSKSPEVPQGDQYYAAAIGGDMVADFLVGRIPARTNEELADYVKKLKAFEAAPLGDWASRAEFIMDDNDEFPDVVNRITAAAMAPQVDLSLLKQWDFEYVPNLRVPGKKRSWGATEEVIRGFNSGLGLLTFFGHGGPNLWSHERMLHLSDLTQLENAPQLPLITCASCDNAWISYPLPPVKQSMGEELVLMPEAGAIGLFGPVAGASPYEHAILVQNLVEGFSRVQLRDTGALILYAKNQYYASTRSSSIPEQYLLLGDPTATLPAPVVQPGLQAEVSSDTVKLQLPAGVTADGSGSVTLSLSSDPLRVLANQPVGSGQSEWHLQLPPTFSGGAVQALVAWDSATSLTRYGATVAVALDEEDELTSAVVLAQEGPVSIAPREGSALTQTSDFQQLGLRLSAKDALTSNLILTAYREGNPVGELRNINPLPDSAFTNADLRLTSPLDAPATSVTVVLMSDLPTSDTDLLSTATLLIPVRGQAELEFVPGTATVSSYGDELRAYRTILLSAELKNSGRQTAKGFTLQALKDDPSTGSELQTINETTSLRMEELAPGETKRVSFRWENAAPGSYSNIYLVANRNKMVRESNFDNNALAMPAFEVGSPGNFIVSSFNVQPAQGSSGTSITATAVLKYEDPVSSHPVAVELGWRRNLDGETSSTRTPVNFQDGYATVTRELTIPAGFNQAYVKVNADLEVEEMDGADNLAATGNMVVTPLHLDSGSQDISAYLSEGMAYNLVSPAPGVLRVAPELTSRTVFLVPDASRVTTGTLISNPDEGPAGWQVAPWAIKTQLADKAGPLGLSIQVPDISEDLVGDLWVYYTPGSAVSPLETRTTDSDVWKAANKTRHEGNSQAANLGNFAMIDGSINLELQSRSPSPVSLNYFRFYPRAVQWESAPFAVPAALVGQQLQFSFTTDQSGWDRIMPQYRTGQLAEGGDIQWQPWQSGPDGTILPLQAAPFIQIRILGIPSPDQQPYLENFRLARP